MYLTDLLDEYVMHPLTLPCYCCCCCMTTNNMSFCYIYVVLQGYEVMYLTDVLDEYVMQQLTEFEDFKFANIAKEDVDTTAEAEGEVRASNPACCVFAVWLVPACFGASSLPAY